MFKGLARVDVDLTALNKAVQGLQGFFNLMRAREEKSQRIKSFFLEKSYSAEILAIVEQPISTRQNTATSLAQPLQQPLHNPCKTPTEERPMAHRRPTYENIAPPRPTPELAAFHQFLRSIPPQLWDLVHKAREARRPCLLCQGEFFTVAVFLPTAPDRWGIAEGWQGGCVYGLCQTCTTLPDRQQRVEAALWADRQQALAARWN